jgi:hypothetical protein
VREEIDWLVGWLRERKYIDDGGEGLVQLLVLIDMVGENPRRENNTL